MKEEQNITTERSRKPRPIRLRAFKIKNTDITRPHSEVKDLLLTKLNNTATAKDRCMLLSPEDSKKEQDLISCYQTSEQTNAVFCTMLRIAPSSDIEQIPDDLLERRNFTMEELEGVGIESAVICKDHYYFAISDDFLVTNLALNKTIPSLQTYIGWFINNELVEFTPMIDVNNQTKLKDLKAIIVRDPSPLPSTNSNTATNNRSQTTQLAESSTKIKLTEAVMAYLSSVMSNTSSFAQIQDGQLISAELLIKFKKPRKMTQEEYANILGAYLKPVSDLDNISFKRADGKTEVKGKDLLRIKPVDIEVTETGKLVEQQVFQEMSKFLVELKNETESS
ncbi:conserved hypothetical protein [Xenorhabdus bovienii str. puntauvense]|uniref:Uncharacterized protein n=1 Tax=Xenorhabdus bovienii str. puntauvense TaxID=1398201 RepID=A0A077NIQ7_XENBV|nr:hypothetical protein [Xenorhabdus bovienii]CDG97720.1 conserved hypothetical protein [Xenorhabdus bovienii str. puntauvense]